MSPREQIHDEDDQDAEPSLNAPGDQAPTGTSTPDEDEDAPG